ncbi:MAG: ChaB [Acidobacteria bacterium]|nr:ChaB [Acidobacteriota bacterium]
MRYLSIEDLPFVYRYNLPVAALHVYREAFNSAWDAAAGLRDRDGNARRLALAAVLRAFEKDPVTGRWTQRGAPPQPQRAAVQESYEEQGSPR